MKNEQIFLSKNYTIIESGIPFTLRFNRKDSSANSAEDTIYMKSGWYIFDNNKLLPFEVEGVKNSPKYNAWIEYDETKLDENVRFRWYTSWVNPKSIESLNSDVVEIDSMQFSDITHDMEKLILGTSDSLYSRKYVVPYGRSFYVPIDTFDCWLFGRGFIREQSGTYHSFSGFVHFNGGPSIIDVDLENQGFSFNPREDTVFCFSGVVLSTSEGAEIDEFLNWLDSKNIVE